jgi:hypothetical protein
MGLFTPAWQGNQKEKAMRAVERENNKDKLTLIAKTAPLEEVRFMAMLKIDVACNDLFSALCLFRENISSQPLLAAVALGDSFSPGWRTDAADKLQDQAALALIAKNDADWTVRDRAVRKLTDPQLLADIAVNDKDSIVRDTAIKNKHLTDQNALAKSIELGIHDDTLKAVIEKISDPSILEYIVKTTKNSGVRYTAIRRITDQALLTDIAKNNSDSSVRSAATELLTDKSVLEEIAKNDDSCNVKRAAEIKLMSLGGQICREQGQHDWDGCVCKRCGKTRDTGHDWDGCKCRSCGKTRDTGHDWSDCEWGVRCKRCGKLNYRCPHCNGTTTTRQKSDYYSGMSDFSCSCGKTFSEHTSMGHG